MKKMKTNKGQSGWFRESKEHREARLLGLDRKRKNSSDSKRWVYGTKTNKWYLVGSNDRDYIHGISQTEFKRIGKIAAKHKYLQPKSVNNRKRKAKRATTSSFKRILQLEDPRVKYWFENKRGDIVSFIRPDEWNPNGEIRVGSADDKFESFAIPVSSGLVETLSPNKIIEIAERGIKTASMRFS
jgi:hypothetical protein